MKTYILKKDNNYIQSIYRGSVSTSSDKGDAIELDSIEQAIQFRNYCVASGYKSVSIISIETVEEEVDLSTIL